MRTLGVRAGQPSFLDEPACRSVCSTRFVLPGWDLPVVSESYRSSLGPAGVGRELVFTALLIAKDAIVNGIGFEF